MFTTLTVRLATSRDIESILRIYNNGVADLSVYIDRSFRGQGVGSSLLESLHKGSKENNFYKIVLFTFPFNESGQGLYRKMGYRQVGVFEKQGLMDGAFIDVMIMEKLL